jgi:hypothetical protein
VAGCLREHRFVIEHRSPHWCGGELVLDRKPDGGSVEYCTGCKWYYDFDAPMKQYIAAGNE